MANLTKKDYDAFKPTYFSVKHVWWLCAKYGRGLTAYGNTGRPIEYYDDEEAAAKALRKFKREAKK